MIGLTSENFGDNNYDSKSIRMNGLFKSGKYNWLNDSNNTLNYIGWSASDDKAGKILSHGLYCGLKDSSRNANVFAKNNFVYKSRNGMYTKRLPVYRSGDIVVLIYNSDIGELSFQLFKKRCGIFLDDNDNFSSLNSYIYNLPSDLTFYWFFGHASGPMSISVIDK